MRTAAIVFLSVVATVAALVAWIKYPDWKKDREESKKSKV